MGQGTRRRAAIRIGPALVVALAAAPAIAAIAPPVPEDADTAPLAPTARSQPDDCLTAIAGPIDLSTRPAATVTVAVAIDVIDIREVDGAAETFTGDLYVRMTWHDERARYSAVGVGFDECSLEPAQVWGPAARLWGPRPEFLNMRSEDRRENPQIEVSPDGDITFTARISGSFDAAFSLREFPFDTQTLAVEIESYFSSDEVRLAPDPALGNDALYDAVADVSLPQWRVVAVEASERESSWAIDPGELYSHFTFEMTFERRFGFYVWKVFIPLVLIVILSWSVFWMSSDHFDGQMAVSITCLLALIAFNFVIGDELPKISYLTLLDWAILFAYLFVFLSAINNVAAHVLASGDRLDAAERLARVSRWLYPLTYIALNAALLVLRI